MIFCQPNGQYLSYSREATEVRKLLKAAGLETRTPHEMRHTCASLLIADGASIVQVAGQLRHSDPSITLRVYAHLSRETCARCSFRRLSAGADLQTRTRTSLPEEVGNSVA